MKVFKLKPFTSKSIKLSKENFEKHTLKRFPYYYKDLKGKMYYFAVCPICNNPIQIIGLYFNKKPYARHFKKSIKFLAEFNQEDYFNCPYFIGNNKKRKGNK